MTGLKKYIWLVAAAVFTCTVLTGCGKQKEDSQVLDSLRDSLSKQQTEEASGDQSGAEPADVREAERNLKLTTSDAVYSYVKGTWTYYDTKNEQDYATLEISEDGSLTFTRLSDDQSCPGKISFEVMAKNDSDPEWSFQMELNGIDELLPEDAYHEEGGTDSDTSGKVYFGAGPEEDYLFLNEIGNGDTMISCYVLNPDYGRSEDAFFQPEWLFYRKSEGKVTKTVEKTSDFYAWVWKREDNGVWLEKMRPHEEESYDEYTNRAYLDTSFTPFDDIGIMRYEVMDSLDTSMLLFSKRWNSAYPLDMYRIATDETGTIVGVSEVEHAFYGSYDLGDTEPEFSAEGRTFHYNGVSYDMEDYAPAVTAIMDCTRVGDWIILDCHVNPHFGLYEFFNIYTGNFEFEIQGANLTWQNDDLSTAVYTMYNEVFDIWGHPVDSIQEGELTGISFLNDTTLQAEYWLIDGEEEMWLDKTIEWEFVDREMFALYEYMLGRTKRQWGRFVEMAPEDAVAFVMVNPDEKIGSYFDHDVHGTEGALDLVTVVSLQDGEKLQLNGESYDCDITDAETFRITVPEGMPTDKLLIKTADGKEASWEVFQISGRIPQHSIFITE